MSAPQPQLSSVLSSLVLQHGVNAPVSKAAVVFAIRGHSLSLVSILLHASILLILE